MYPEFNPYKFKTYFIQNLLSLNYMTESNLINYPEFTPVIEALHRKEVKTQMLKEYNILKEVSEKLLQIYEPVRKHYRDARKAKRGITVTARNLRTINQPTPVIPDPITQQFNVPILSPPRITTVSPQLTMNKVQLIPTIPITRKDE